VSTPGPRQIDNWQDAEHNAADWMRYWGYKDARALPGGPDSGIDVRASGAIGQVKFQGAQVGRPALQRLVGARADADDQLFFFTGSNYSKAAVEYADERGIVLFQYDPWGRMKPMNPVAVAVKRSKAETQIHNAQAPLAEEPDSLRHPRQRQPRIRPSRDWTPVKQHFKKHWAAWAAGYFVLLPVVMIGDQEFYGNSPLWQDMLKWISSWIAAVLFLAVYRRLRYSRNEPFRRAKTGTSGSDQRPPGTADRFPDGSK
jgi:hypothetical protein